MKLNTILILLIYQLICVGCKKSEDVIDNQVYNLKISGFPTDAVIVSPDNDFLLIDYYTGNIEKINNEGERIWFMNNAFSGFNPNSLNYLKNPVRLFFNETSDLTLLEVITDPVNTSDTLWYFQLSQFSKTGSRNLIKKIQTPKDSVNITLYDMISFGNQTIVAFRQDGDIHLMKLDESANLVWDKSFFGSAPVKLALLNNSTFLLLQDFGANLLVDYRNVNDGMSNNTTSLAKLIYNTDGSSSLETFGLSNINSPIIVKDNSIYFSGNRDHKINASEVFSRFFVTRINTQTNQIKSNYVEMDSDVECLGGFSGIGPDGKNKIVGLYAENSATYYPVQINVNESAIANTIEYSSFKITNLASCFPLAFVINNDETLTIVGKKGSFPEYIPLNYVLKPKFYSQKTFLIRIRI